MLIRSRKVARIQDNEVQRLREVVSRRRSKLKDAEQKLRCAEGRAE